MNTFLDSSATFLGALVNYPRAEIFIAFAFMLLLPLVALTCIYLRDHRRNGEGRPNQNEGRKRWRDVA